MATIELKATPIQVFERNFILHLSADELQEVVDSMRSARFAPLMGYEKPSKLEKLITTALGHPAPESVTEVKSIPKKVFGWFR